ncbi:DUF2516 family protein [Aeromicrobium camelliae]|uniref:DUF2516 family protein n=1 Tax=Aeromicrobium camelliae TaxID=1538144 RepID=A0A3N6ZF27_9ACTN|nr:DUF2516 family protein [Aeromicrobium camelliae]RQN08711.1 DUF2516 family protein [Aeromicrobium camelliae]
MFTAYSYLALALSVILLCVKAFALIDCIRRRPYDFELAGTLQKKAWLVILALSVAVHLIFVSSGPLGLLNLAGTVAALVYLAQLRSVTS